MKHSTDVRGFSLIELLLVVAVIGVISAIAIPTLMNTSAQIRIANNARQVERELQGARMKAVRSNRAIRVRFNCPANSQYRMVEVLGTVQTPAADDSDARAAARCGYAMYPYPDTDPEFFALPNQDGPIEQLQSGVSFASTVQTVEFWPDGTAHAQTDGSTPWPPIPDAGITLRVYDTKNQSTVNSSISVNGLGKITLSN